MIRSIPTEARWGSFLVKVLRDFLLIVSSAIVASYISTFLNSWLLVEVTGTKQFSFDTALVFAFFGAIFGPMFAWSFLIFFMLPWVMLLHHKRNNNFLLWVVVPAIVSAIWGQVSTLLVPRLGKILSDFSAIPLYGVAGFLTALFMWLLNKYLFREANQNEVLKIIDEEDLKKD